MKSRRYRNTNNSRKNKITRKYTRKQMGGVKQTQIPNKKALTKSWKDGSTMWVVHGEGIRVFSKDKYDDVNKLFTEIKPFIEDKKYKVFAN